MRQTDNREIFARLVSQFEKDIRAIKSYGDFKKYKAENSQMISFIDSCYIYLGYSKHPFSSITYGTRKVNFYKICFWLCVAICSPTLIWTTNVLGLRWGHSWAHRDPLDYNTHRIAYKIMFILLIISAIAIIITLIVRKIYKRRIGFEKYKDHIQWVKWGIKRKPQEEVDVILKIMKEDGIEFPKGYNFKV